LARGGGDGGGSSGGSSGGDSWGPTVRPHRPSAFLSTDCRVGSCAAWPTRPPSAGSQAAVARGAASTARPLRAGADWLAARGPDGRSKRRGWRRWDFVWANGSRWWTTEHPGPLAGARAPRCSSLSMYNTAPWPSVMRRA
jgi:hypothetical protein